MQVQQLTYPATTVITLEEAKNHLRVDTNLEDMLIMDCIRSATSMIEAYTNRILISSTYTAFLDEAEIAEKTPFELRGYYPITEISSIEYYNISGIWATISSADYSKDIIGHVARIYFTKLPQVKANTLNTYKINFTAGYTDRDKIPYEIIGWVKIITGFYYESRQSEYTGNTGNVTNELQYNYQRSLDKFISTL